MGINTTYGSTSGAEIREDVLDVIYQITPEDTPFFNMIGDSDANSPVHQWTTRDISTRQDNAVQEGASFTFEQIQTASRVSHLTQIFRKLPRVPRSRQSSTHVGISDLMADQIQQSAVGLKTDVEHALLRGSQVSGTSNDSTARRLGGFDDVITNNLVADYNGSAGTLTESLFNDLLEEIWNDGGRAQDVLVGSKLKRTISSFTASSTKFFMQDDRRVVNTIGVYESDFHVTNIHLSRDMRNTAGTGGDAGQDVFAFDRSFFAKAWLDRPIVERLPKIADAQDALIIAECTLEYGNENAAGKISQLGTIST